MENTKLLNLERPRDLLMSTAGNNMYRWRQRLSTDVYIDGAKQLYQYNKCSYSVGCIFVILTQYFTIKIVNSADPSKVKFKIAVYPIHECYPNRLDSYMPI